MALHASFLLSAPVISLIDAFARGWMLLPIDSTTLVILCTQADQRGTHRGVDDPATAQASSECSVMNQSAAIMMP
jgi:hypothetical protein